MSDRIAAMKKFIEEQPENPFPRYALALELKSAGELEAAVEAFVDLREKMPDYVATYLQLGMSLEELGDEDRAREVFSTGIEVATKAGNAHAKSELQDALDALD